MTKILAHTLHIRPLIPGSQNKETGLIVNTPLWISKKGIDGVMNTLINHNLEQKPVYVHQQGNPLETQRASLSAKKPNPFLGVNRPSDLQRRMQPPSS